MSHQDLLRVEYTGEVSPGNEILVVDDDHAVIDTEQTEAGGQPVVGSQAIARVAVTGYIEEGHREKGFLGVWRDLRRPDIEVSVRLVGSAGVGNALRIVADPNQENAAANSQLVRTRPGHRFFLATPTEKEAA